MDPEGKVALVTGGASGIGFAIVNELLRNGANVAVCDLNAEMAKDSMKKITEEFGKEKALFIHMDITKEDDFEGAMKTTKNHFKRLDIVVNNAGIVDDRNWEGTIEVNLKGTIRGTLLAMKHMGKDNGGEGGTIVNIASIAGLTYEPILPIYTTSKHGVLAVSKCFGMPFHYNRTGVRVVALCPGATQTRLLVDCLERLLSPAWIDEAKKLMGDYEAVPPDVVAKNFLQLLRNAENGSVWVSVGDETYPIDLPNHDTLGKKS